MAARSSSARNAWGVCTATRSGTVEGLDHDGVAVLVVLDPLDGVAHRHAGDRRVGAGVHRGHHGLVQLGRGQRTGGVVHDDHRGIGIDDGEGGPDRVGPLRAALHGDVGGPALDQRVALGPIAGRQHHDDVVGRGAGRGQGHGR